MMLRVPRKAFLFLTMAVLASWGTAVPTAAQTASGNLLDNGSAEIDSDQDGVPDGWGVQGLTLALDGQVRVDGQYSVKVTGGGRSAWLRTGSVRVTGGEVYTLSFKLRQQDVPEQARNATWSVRWTGPDGHTTQSLEYLEGSMDWTRRTCAVQAPPEATTATIVVRKFISTSTLWLDDAAIVPGVTPKTEAELSVEERATGLLAFDFLGKRLDRFLVFREPYLSDEAEEAVRALRDDLAAVKQQIRAGAPDAAALAHYMEGHTREISWQESLFKKLTPFAPSPAMPWHGRWHALADRLGDLKQDVRANLAQTRPEQIREHTRRVFGERATYGVGVATSLQKVMREGPFLGPIADELSIALAGHEHEGVQLVIIPLDHELRNVKVTASALTGPDGAQIGADDIHIAPIGYVETVQPEYQVEHVGWWPDPLLPVGPFDAAKGTNQPVWIDVYASADQPAGLYRGTLTIAPANADPIEVTLSVRVWDYALPVRGEFKVLDRFNLGLLKRYYGWETIPRSAKEQWYRFLLEHRFPGTELYGTTMQPGADMLPFVADLGLNAVNISNVSYIVMDRDTPTGMSYHAPTPEEREEIRSSIQEAAALLQGYGLEDAGYVYAFDEVHNTALQPVMREVADLVHSAAPGVKFATTTTYPPIDGLVGAVDTWVPMLGTHTDAIQQRIDAGDEVFFYIFAIPLHPFPNAATLDYPAIDGRISFWIASNMRWTGFLHWLSNGWKANTHDSGVRWPDVPWTPWSDERFANRRNGEGYFIYPGPDGQPLSSIRFKLMRDGIEDWEMLNMLRKRRDRAVEAGDAEDWVQQADAALAQARALAPKDYDYRFDPAALLAARRVAAEALQNAPDFGEQTSGGNH